MLTYRSTALFLHEVRYLMPMYSFAGKSMKSSPICHVQRILESSLRLSLQRNCYHTLNTVAWLQQSAKFQASALKVIRPQGSAESIQSGDSILAPHSHTFIRADPSDVPVPSPSGEWQMASLNFLLPKEPTNAGTKRELRLLEFKCWQRVCCGFFQLCVVYCRQGGRAAAPDFQRGRVLVRG